MTELRKRLELLRTAFGLRQNEFAERIGVTASYISALEAGKRTALSKSSSKLISKLFLCDEKWLLTGDTDVALCSRFQQSAFLNKDRIAHDAGVPQKLIDAFSSSQIGPSDELIKRLDALEYGIGIGHDNKKTIEKEIAAIQPGGEKYVEYLQLQIVHLTEENNRYGEMIDNLMEQNKQLKKKE